MAFPISDGVPIMVTEMARIISDDDVKRLRAMPLQSENGKRKVIK